jgi:hypothetical protein
VPALNDLLWGGANMFATSYDQLWFSFLFKVSKMMSGAGEVIACGDAAS